MLIKLNPEEFDWLRWCGGGVTRLGLSATRENILFDNVKLIRKYAIGYCDGSELLCRPKAKCIAIMFLKDEEYFWTHITKEEFDFLFPKEWRE